MPLVLKDENECVLIFILLKTEQKSCASIFSIKFVSRLIFLGNHVHMSLIVLG